MYLYWFLDQTVASSVSSLERTNYFPSFLHPWSIWSHFQIKNQFYLKMKNNLGIRGQSVTLVWQTECKRTTAGLFSVIICVYCWLSPDQSWSKILLLFLLLPDVFLLLQSKPHKSSLRPVAHLCGPARLCPLRARLSTNSSAQVAEIGHQDRAAGGVGVSGPNLDLLADLDSSRGDKVDRGGAQLLGSVSRG